MCDNNSLGNTMAVDQEMEIDPTNESLVTSCTVDMDNMDMESIQESIHPNEGSTCNVMLSSSAEENEMGHNLYNQFLGIDLGVETEIIIGNGENELMDQLENKLLTLEASESFRFNICYKNEERCLNTSSPVLLEAEQGTFELKLISFVNTSPINHLTSCEMFDRAKQYKEIGNKLFKDKYVSLAFRKYSRAIKYLILISDSLLKENQILEDEYKTLKMQCYLNIAACQLHYKNFKCAIENCNKVLKFDPLNVKALYRRATCYRNTGEFDEAVADLEKAQDLDPANNIVKKELLQIKTEVHNQNANLAKAMSKMFTS